MQTRRPPKTLDSAALLQYAAQLLGGRAMSSSELRTKLKKKATIQEDVESVLDKMKELGYLNDKRFAASYANWRLENQGFGKTRVMHDLMARRVAPALAQEAVADAFQDVNEIELIESFLARKYRGKNLGEMLKEEKNLASAFRRLRGAGFSAGASIRVLKRYAVQAEELEALDESDETPG
jgi:regulatory protein